MRILEEASYDEVRAQYLKLGGLTPETFMADNEALQARLDAMTAERDAARLALAEAEAREVGLRAAAQAYHAEHECDEGHDHGEHPERCVDCGMHAALATKPDFEALREFGRRCVVLERTRTSWGEESDVVDAVLRGET